jgi:glycosyltransferase involved in cell wall biosynthesis
VRCSDVDFSQYARSTRLIVGWLARLSSRPWAVATNSRAGRRAHELLGYTPRRWVYLPNGVDTEEWRPDPGDAAGVRRELGLSPDEIVFAHVARVDPMKDHATFLGALPRVLQRNPNARFVLIGRGTESLSLPAGSEGRVLRLGERRDVPRLLRGFDVFVLSSVSEGFPNVVVESMATGLPCVVTDVGDAAELVRNAGIIVSPSDSAALAEAICSLLAEGGEAIKRLGNEARARVRSNWSLERSIQAYFELWQEANRG